MWEITFKVLFKNSVELFTIVQLLWFLIDEVILVYQFGKHFEKKGVE